MPECTGVEFACSWVGRDGVATLFSDGGTDIDRVCDADDDEGDKSQETESESDQSESENGSKPAA